MDIALSIMVLAAIVLLVGAAVLWRKGGHAKQVGLMLVLVVVLIANVLIWSLPGPDGEALADKAAAPAG